MSISCNLGPTSSSDSLLRCLHHGLLMVTLAPVWWCHGKVFRAAGIGFFQLMQGTHWRLHQDLRRIGLRVRLRKLIGRVLPLEDMASAALK